MILFMILFVVKILLISIQNCDTTLIDFSCFRLWILFGFLFWVLLGFFGCLVWIDLWRMIFLWFEEIFVCVVFKAATYLYATLFVSCLVRLFFWSRFFVFIQKRFNDFLRMRFLLFFFWCIRFLFASMCVFLFFNRYILLGLSVWTGFHKFFFKVVNYRMCEFWSWGDDLAIISLNSFDLNDLVIVLSLLFSLFFANVLNLTTARPNFFQKPLFIIVSLEIDLPGSIDKRSRALQILLLQTPCEIILLHIMIQTFVMKELYLRMLRGIILPDFPHVNLCHFQQVQKLHDDPFALLV